MVLNLDVSTAISNSICTVHDFKTKWVDLWREDREMAQVWMDRLEESVLSKEEKQTLIKMTEEFKE